MSKKAKQLGIDRVFDISMGMFEYSVRVVIVKEISKAIEYASYVYEEKVNDPDESLARGRLFRKAGYIPILWLPAFPESPRDIATMAHECVHAVLTMFDWAQVPQCWQTEEVECHAVGHLVNEILKRKEKV